MSDYDARDPILQGRATDPAVRQGIDLVDYPDYIVAAALDGDGLTQVHNKIMGEGVTPQAAAQAITDLIIDLLAEEMPAQTPEGAAHALTSDQIARGTHEFPQPITRKFFGKTDPPPPAPVFDDAVRPIDFSTPLQSALLLRAEAITRRWREGRIEEPRAVHLLEAALADFKNHKIHS